MENFGAAGHEIKVPAESKESIFDLFLDAGGGTRKIESMSQADDLLQKHFYNKDGGKDVKNEQSNPFAAFGFDPEKFQKQVMETQLYDVQDFQHKEFDELYNRFTKPELYSKSMRVGPNCYAFALNEEKDPRTGEKYTVRPYPGMFSGINQEKTQHIYMDAIRAKDTETAKLQIAKCIKNDLHAIGRDFAEVGSKDYQTKPGERLISISASSTFEDFHFMRRGENGTWFHKEGVTAPRAADCSNQTIYDPEKCNRGAYDMFLGYYVIKDK